MPKKTKKTDSVVGLAERLRRGKMEAEREPSAEALYAAQEARATVPDGSPDVTQEAPAGRDVLGTPPQGPYSEDSPEKRANDEERKKILEDAKKKKKKTVLDLLLGS